MITIEILRACVVTESFEYAMDGSGDHRSRIVVLKAGTTLRGELREPATRAHRDISLFTFIREQDVGKLNPDRLFIKREKFRALPECLGPARQ